MNVDNQIEILNQLENLKVKNLEEYNLREILFTVVCAPNIRKFDWTQTLLNICFHRYCFTVEKKNDDLLFISYDYERGDHNGMIQRYYALYNCDVMHLSTKGIRKMGVGKCLSNIPASFIRFCKYYIALAIVKNKYLRRRLACSLLDVYRFKSQLEKEHLLNKVMVQYFDGGLYENTITQFCKLHGMKTVTLQHGQPVYHGKNTDLLNQTMILNLSSDYIMVTGAFSKKQFILAGVPEEKIIVCGSLRKVKLLSKDVHRQFIVLLDCPTYESSIKSNQLLIDFALKISEQFNYSFIIKCHPQDDPHHYKNIVEDKAKVFGKEILIDEALDCMDFALLHVSGAYLDAMAAGVKSFCLMDENAFPLVREENDKFSDLNDLKKKLRWWFDCDYNQKRNYFDQIVDYYLSPKDASKRNKEFVKGLL